MKTFLILASLLFALPSQAGLGSLLLGAMIGASSVPVQKPVRSDMQIQIDSIKASLPHRCKETTTIYGTCWSQFKSPLMTYQVAPNSANELHSYFVNMGYSVRLDGLKLTFDFRKEHEKFLIHDTKLVSVETVLIVAFLSILPLWYLRVNYKYRKRVKAIKTIYEHDPSHIFFSEKSDKKKFEEAISKNELPLYWQVNISDDTKQITGITYYNGRSIGRVAYNAKAFSAAMRHNLGGLYNIKNK